MINISGTEFATQRETAIGKIMRSLGIILIFVAVGLLLAIGIAVTTGLSLKISLIIAGISCLLVYLMLDLRPEANPGDATIIRLTKGSWYRKRK